MYSYFSMAYEENIQEVGGSKAESIRLPYFYFRDGYIASYAKILFDGGIKYDEII